MKQQSSCDKYDSLSKIASLESQSRRASDVSAANSSPMARTSHKAPPLYSKVKMSPARATNSHPHKKNAASTAAAAVGAHKEKADLFQHTEDADSDDLIKQIKFYYWKLCNIEGALQTFYDESGKVDPLECLEEIRTILYEVSSREVLRII